VKQLIVNADDFGLTENVNRGILDAHRKGIVTSTTLLANGMAFDSAVASGKRCHRLGIGVHLNLTEGKPVAEANEISTLVDPGGRLHMVPARLWAGIAAGLVSMPDIEVELRAQIMKVFRAGITPTHLDGHKHVHVLPGVSDVVIRLANEFRIPAVRCPLERNAHAVRPPQNRGGSRIATLKQNLVGRAVSSLAGSFKQKLGRVGLLSPDNFCGIRQTGFLDASAIRQVLGELLHGVSELMCHPGYRDNTLERTKTRLLTQREIEIQALTAASVTTLIASGGIQLWNYKDFVELSERPGMAA
jgi:predicted glycoside hydrolase/deacetylase ChbG (UPF0249 family)